MYKCKTISFHSPRCVGASIHIVEFTLIVNPLPPPPIESKLIFQSYSPWEVLKLRPGWTCKLIKPNQNCLKGGGRLKRKKYISPHLFLGVTPPNPCKHERQHRQPVQAEDEAWTLHSRVRGRGGAHDGAGVSHSPG